MIPTLSTLACALVLGQPTPANLVDGVLQPRPVRGQELVYRGTYSEETSGLGVQFERGYRLENRVFVLESTAQGAELAILTLWKSRPGGAETATDLEINSVRLERCWMNDQGKISWTVPLAGPPTLECGCFVEVPFGRVSKDQSWEVLEADRPLLRWRVQGTEVVNGTRCVQLVGEQQSDDWDKPRADRAAWRRQETVWLVPQAGYAARLERIIEQRAPARQHPGQRLVVKYELESNLQYPGQLYEDRRREITQILAFRDQIVALLPRAGEVGARPFEAVLARIKAHSDNQPPTPYREALRQVQRLAEAGKRGEMPPEAETGSSAPPPQTIALGKPAPDFLTVDWVSRQSARLRHWLGQPILLVFYAPQSPSSAEALRFAKQLAQSQGVVVLGLTVVDDRESILKQRDELHLTFPLLSGMGLRQSYAVEATPKLVVLDAAGVVRGSYLGWGPEIPRSVAEDLRSGP